MADQDARFAQMPEIKLLPGIEQIVEHAAGEVAQIGGAFAEIFIFDRLQHGDVAVGRGVKGIVGVGLLFTDDLDDFLDEHAVFKHQQVRVENIRLGGAHRVGDAALDFGDLLAGADEGVFEAFNFRHDGVRLQFAPDDGMTGAVQDNDFPATNTCRNSDAAIYLFAFYMPGHDFT